ncbi:Predicted membrane fusion protein (MFP) component of efflux pump, membrane anchor protein YbhG [hydrothermal vent metagenome]|uniref:Predicted membrane fusion protein (MFP) component of efflux pump, membrane anchor protein YbhG n=1 Tax=hydrothermal vent metagenome TaxID=652676 RepID=A0A3B1CFF3_9ZZZZ
MKTFNNLMIFIILFGFIACSEENDSSLIEHSGTIETTNIILSSQVPGVVNNLFVEEGEDVKLGDTLAIIDHEKFDLQLAQAKASLSAAEAQLKILKRGARKEDKKRALEILKQAELNLNQVRTNRERMEKLHASKAITEKQYDDAVTAYELAVSKYNEAKQNVDKVKSARPEEIKSAEANVLKAKSSIGLIQKNINDCYLTSPLEGQIVGKFIEIGESVSFMSSMFKISNLNKANLIIYITEKELALVKYGQEAEITIDAFNNKSFNGKVVFISPEAEFTPKNIQTKDERTKLVFAVKIDIENSEHLLKPGMPADARIKQ